MYGKRRLDVWCSDDERLVVNNGISPFCKRADYYYHSVMSIDAACVGDREKCILSIYDLPECNRQVCGRCV